MLAPWKKSYDKPRRSIKKQRHHFANKYPYGQRYGFSSSHVWMWEFDHKEGWMPKNWCFQIVVLEKTLESPLNCKAIKIINPKGYQPWIFIGRTEVEAETPILGHLMQRTDSFEMTLMLGKVESGRRRGWQRINGCIASPSQWTWVWVNSRSCWWTGRSDMLQSMGSQRAWCDWATELILGLSCVWLFQPHGL